MTEATSPTRPRARRRKPDMPTIPVAEPTLADRPLTSPHLSSPVLKLDVHRANVDIALAKATRLGKIELRGAPVVAQAPNGVFSLAQWQSPFKTQNDRGTCCTKATRRSLKQPMLRKLR